MSLKPKNILSYQQIIYSLGSTADDIRSPKLALKPLIQ